jgi:hypothetical protein
MANEMTKPGGNGKALTELLAEKFHLDRKVMLDSLTTTYFKGLSQGELVAALTVCQTYDLNPFLREIHCTKSGDRLLSMVGIDGWIKIAKRTGLFNGFDDPVFVFDDEGKPFSCTVKVHKKDEEHPTGITVYFREWVKNTPVWNTQPCHMLYVKAVKLALRMAFGISGLDVEDDPKEAEPVMVKRTISLQREPDPFVSSPEPSAVEEPLEPGSNG